MVGGAACEMRHQMAHLGIIHQGKSFAMKGTPAIVLAASLGGCLTASQGLDHPTAPQGLDRPTASQGLGHPTASQGLDRPSAKYDASWYRANGWSGEYPDGFTMAGNVTTKIRGSPNLDSPKSISCVLRKGATYHQWNKNRVISDRLEFISFTKIETYDLNASFTVELRRQSDGDDTTIQFKKGDQWLYLAGPVEGKFLIKFDDTIYIADQDLYEKSTKSETPVNDDESTYDEWLKLRCANGAVGWILFNEIKDGPEFAAPNITGYASASDLQSQPKAASHE
jgi:hypothetical protein